MRDDALGKQIAEFTGFLVENVDEVTAVFQRLENSRVLEEYEGTADTRNLFSAFAVVGIIYRTYLQKKGSEREADEFLEGYVQESENRIRLMSEFAGGIELSKLLSHSVWEHLSVEKEIILVNISMVDGEVIQALSNSAAILFDEEFYYFPPRLLKEICKPVLQLVSEPELKKQLKNSGILYCNSADYTVKKQVINVYGGVERPRMMWIYKDFLLSPDHLFLEDVFGQDTQSFDEGGFS